MYLFADVFWAPKAGSTEAEFEDAFHPTDKLEGEHGTFRFAIADGATESSFCRLWARLLVKAVGTGRLSPNYLEPTLSKLKKCWARSIHTKSLPWYAEEKAQSGAFSTLLGLFLTEPKKDDGRWEAFAIGDSCLFQVRDNQLLASFPIKDSKSFTSRPVLLSSRDQSEDGRESLQLLDGTWKYEDHFFLMTDALAQWFLTRYEFGEQPWSLLQSLGSRDYPSNFASWVNGLRQNKLLKNDDVTLWRISISYVP